MTTGQYPALEWLQRRTEGESAAEVAARAGVSEAAVRRATDPYGSFPDSPGFRRAFFADRTQQWIEQRRHDDTAGNTKQVHIGFVGPHYLVPNTKS